MNTYIEIPSNYTHPTENLIRVDHSIKMNEVPTKVSSIYKRYCIEIIFNNEVLKPYSILTTEPWVTYLCLVKNYLTSGYSMVYDLTQPVIYYFSKDGNGNIDFKIQNETEESGEFHILLPEEDFLLAIFDSLIYYLEFMREYNPKYFDYWTKRHEKDLYFIAKELESKYLVIH